MTDQDVPPQDLEAERMILGSMFFDAEAPPALMEELGPADFYAPSHGTIFEAALELWEANRPCDMVGVSQRLQEKGLLEMAGGRDALVIIAQCAVGAVRAVHAAQRVRSLSLLRSVRNLARDAYERAFVGADAEAVLDWLGGEVMKVGEVRRSVAAVSLGPLLAERAAAILDECENGTIQGLPTGFPGLDDKLRGLQPSRLYVVAARPGVGKSVLAWQIARHVASGGRRVLFFSLEMAGEEIAERDLVQNSGLLAEDLRLRRSLGVRGTERLQNAVNEAFHFPLEVDDDASVTASTIRARCRKAHRLAPLELVVVDYLQLMAGDDKKAKREEAVAAMSRSMKLLAKELGIPVVVLSQLNRLAETRQDKRPRLSDLRESGAIEQDADCVLLIHRPSLYDDDVTDDVATVDVAKNRSGPTGEVAMTWNMNRVRFESRA